MKIYPPQEVKPQMIPKWRHNSQPLTDTTNDPHINPILHMTDAKPNDALRSPHDKSTAAPQVRGRGLFNFGKKRAPRMKFYVWFLGGGFQVLYL